ncbi:MAG: OmpH family outer membrane protein [Pyrinomonadaceae bacterium]
MSLIFRTVAGVLVFIGCVAASYAQTAPAKIALINTDAFYDEKTGITKLVAANKQLDAEFASQIKALQDSGIKIKAITSELQNMQKLPAAAFNQAAYNAKLEEGELLERQITRRKTELEDAIGKRRQVVVAPINAEIGKGITEFANKNGFGAVFDVNKLGESGVLLFLAENADVTRQFITFYNARPATAATPRK